MIFLLVFSILSIPTVSEIIDDRNGETPEQKKKDVFVRAMLMIVSAGVATAIVQTNLHYWPLMITYFKCWFLSFAIFFLIFDYCIHAILIHRGIIETKESAFTYTGKTSDFDKFKLWVRIGPWGRFAVKMAVFIGALIFYF